MILYALLILVFGGILKSSYLISFSNSFVKSSVSEFTYLSIFSILTISNYKNNFSTLLHIFNVELLILDKIHLDNTNLRLNCFYISIHKLFLVILHGVIISFLQSLKHGCHNSFLLISFRTFFCYLILFLLLSIQLMK